MSTKVVRYVLRMINIAEHFSVYYTEHYIVCYIRLDGIVASRHFVVICILLETSIQKDVAYPISSSKNIV